MTIAADATLVTIPCFSEAPWDAEQLEPLTGRRPVRTMRLPEGSMTWRPTPTSSPSKSQTFPLTCWSVIPTAR
jgi:hypothetical protein